MSILNEIKSYEYDKNRKEIFGIKSAVIWGNSNKTNSQFPLLYISKPKGISKKDFDILLDSITIIIKRKELFTDNDLSGMTRDMVVPMYVTFILSAPTPEEVSKVNHAIVGRWSLSALEYIKNKAWRRFNILK